MHQGRFFILVSEIDELHGDGKFFGTDGGNNGLQFIPAFALDADFFALNLGGDLELAGADETGDFLGDGGLDALFDFDGLSGMAQGGNIGGALINAFQTDTAFGEFADDDFVEGIDFKLAFGGQFDVGFFQLNLGFAALEIETIGQFFFGLIYGIFNFHRVNL
jgi:hypothetical protein